MASGMTAALPQFNLKLSIVDGAAAATNIAITGIATEDLLVAVIESTTKASIASRADRLSDASITSAGNIQLATTNSTSNQLEVWWVDRSL